MAEQKEPQVAIEPEIKGEIPMDMNSLIFALSAFTYHFAALDGMKLLADKDPRISVVHSVEELKVSRDEFNKNTMEASEISDEE